MRTVTAALVSYLNADATLMGLAPGQAWVDVTPEQASTPAIVVSLQSAALIEDMCGTPVCRRFRFSVTVEGLQDAVATVRSAAARIEDLLHRVSWAATGWDVTRSVFVDVQERAYQDGDVRHSAVIGLLDVVAERTN